VPLLVAGPDLALGLDESAEKVEAGLVAVVPDFLLEVLLQEVEAGDGVVLGRGRVLGPDSPQQCLRLAPLVQEAQDLVDLVGNDVPVFVGVDPLADHPLLTPVRHVLSVFFGPPLFLPAALLPPRDLRHRVVPILFGRA